MKEKKKKKKGGGFFDLYRKEVGKEKRENSSFFSFSRVRFARVSVDFRKAKENDVCVKAKLTL